MFSQLFLIEKSISPRRKVSPVSVSSMPELEPEKMISLHLNLEGATPPVGINTESLNNKDNLAISKRDFAIDLERGIKVRYDFDGEIVAPKFIPTDLNEERFDEIDTMCGDGANVMYRCGQGSPETPAFGNHFIYGIFYLFMLSGIALSNNNNVNNEVNMTVIYSKKHETVKFKEKFSYGRIVIQGEEAAGSVSMDSTQVINHDGSYHHQSTQALILTLPKKVYEHVKTFLESKYAQIQDSDTTLSQLLSVSQEDNAKFQLDLFAKALKNAGELLAKPLSVSSQVSDAPTLSIESPSASSKPSSMLDKFSRPFSSFSFPSLFNTASSEPPKRLSTHQVPSSSPVSQPSPNCRQESSEIGYHGSKSESNLPSIMY